MRQEFESCKRDYLKVFESDKVGIYETPNGVFIEVFDFNNKSHLAYANFESVYFCMYDLFETVIEFIEKYTSIKDFEISKLESVLEMLENEHNC
jgi:hypothetical protein